MLKSRFLCVLVLALVSMPLALGFQQQNNLRVMLSTTTTTTTTRGIHSALLVGPSQTPVKIRNPNDSSFQLLRDSIVWKLASTGRGGRDDFSSRWKDDFYQ
jgi:hypothetical protein